jgi:hypothetical protein
MRDERLEEILASLTPEQIELQPFYHDLKSEFVQPDDVVVGTKYFWTKWAPLLGPTLTVLIVRLRMHCYYNKLTKEKRDWCFPTQDTLAAEAGVSRRTVIRELQKPEARYFVRIKPRSRYDPERGQTIRTSSLYHVAMDDPLVPDDMQRLAALAAERILEEQSAQVECKVPNWHFTPPSTVKCQNVTLRSCDNLAHKEVPLRGTSDNNDNNARPRENKSTSEGTMIPSALPPLAQPEADDLVDIFERANDRPATGLERARLLGLAARFDEAARQDKTPSTGMFWLTAAIDEAVNSGAARDGFVSAGLLEKICLRWSEEGFRSERVSTRRATGSPGRQPGRPRGNRRPGVRRASTWSEEELRAAREADATAMWAEPPDQEQQEQEEQADGREQDEAGQEDAPPEAAAGEPGSEEQAEAEALVELPLFSVRTNGRGELSSDRVWRETLELAGPQAGLAGYWLSRLGLAGIRAGDGALVVGAPNRFVANVLAGRLHSVQQALSQVLGREVHVVCEPVATGQEVQGAGFG